MGSSMRYVRAVEVDGGGSFRCAATDPSRWAIRYTSSSYYYHNYYNCYNQFSFTSIARRTHKPRNEPNASTTDAHTERNRTEAPNEREEERGREASELNKRRKGERLDRRPAGGRVKSRNVVRWRCSPVTMVHHRLASVVVGTRVPGVEQPSAQLPIANDFQVTEHGYHPS